MDDKEQLIKLLDVIGENIDWQQYHDDLEPMSFYDSGVNDKVRAIISYLKILGLENIALELEKLTPVQGNATSVISYVTDFVKPQVEKLDI